MIGCCAATGPASSIVPSHPVPPQPMLAFTPHPHRPLPPPLPLPLPMPRLTGISDVLFDNVSLDGTGTGPRIKTQRGRGGYVKNVTFANFVLKNVQVRASVREGRGCPLPRATSFWLRCRRTLRLDDEPQSLTVASAPNLTVRPPPHR